MPRTLEKNSPCKVNLLLNILGRRADGFHELETVMQPVDYCDRLAFSHGGKGIELTCDDPKLAADTTNLVHRAATAFMKTAGITEGVRIRLEKRIPLMAGLGGGSGNAATTLLALNELFDGPLRPEQLTTLAAALGSDVAFFLQTKPALATGRGEKIISLEPFPALPGKALLLIHPGFGVSTAWAYQNLARFPEALNGKAGRAQKLIQALQTEQLAGAEGEFYNSLEAPVLEKYPVLTLFQEYLRAHGATVALMSGSGSTTFAIFENPAAAETALEIFKGKFGKTGWTAVVTI